MDAVGIERQAREYADKVAPRPKIDPITGGMSGGVATGLLLSIFTGLAHIDIGIGNTVPMIVAIGLGMAVPWLYLQNLEKRHSVEYSNKWAELRAREKRNADRT